MDRDSDYAIVLKTWRRNGFWYWRHNKYDVHAERQLQKKKAKKETIARIRIDRKKVQI